MSGYVMSIDTIARIAHEVNRAYCESLGDHTQVAWDLAPEWQKQSAIHGVEFHLRNPDASPGASHENWLELKHAEGWKYGAVKDADKKEHPCMVLFSELPTEQRAKDYLFQAVVRNLAEVQI